MEKVNTWIQPGHIDNIFKIYEKSSYNESGEKYVCIKPSPDEKKKSIN